MARPWSFARPSGISLVFVLALSCLLFSTIQADSLTEASAEANIKDLKRDLQEVQELQKQLESEDAAFKVIDSSAVVHQSLVESSTETKVIPPQVVTTVVMSIYKAYRAFARYQQIIASRKKFLANTVYHLQEFKCFNAITSLELTKVLEISNTYSSDMKKSLSAPMPFLPIIPVKVTAEACSATLNKFKPQFEAAFEKKLTFLQYMDLRCEMISECAAAEMNIDDLMFELKNLEHNKGRQQYIDTLIPKLKDIFGPALEYMNNRCANPANKGVSFSDFIIESLDKQAKESDQFQQDAAVKAIEACSGSDSIDDSDVAKASVVRMSAVMDFLQTQAKFTMDAYDRLVKTSDAEATAAWKSVLPFFDDRKTSNTGGASGWGSFANNVANNIKSDVDGKQATGIFANQMAVQAKATMAGALAPAGKAVGAQTKAIGAFSKQMGADLSDLMKTGISMTLSSASAVLDSVLNGLVNHMVNKQKNLKPSSIYMRNLNERCDSLMDMAKFMIDLEKFNYERTSFLLEQYTITDAWGLQLSSINVFEDKPYMYDFIFDLFNHFRYAVSDLTGEMVAETCQRYLGDEKYKSKQYRDDCTTAFNAAKALLSGVIDGPTRAQVLQDLKEKKASFGYNFVFAQLDGKRNQIDQSFKNVIAQMGSANCMPIRYTYQANFERIASRLNTDFAMRMSHSVQSSKKKNLPVCQLENLLYCAAHTVKKFCVNPTEAYNSLAQSNTVDPNNLATIYAKHFFKMNEYHPFESKLQGITQEEVDAAVASSIVDRVATISSELDTAYQRVYQESAADSATAGKTDAPPIDLFEQIVAYAMEYEAGKKFEADTPRLGRVLGFAQEESTSKTVPIYTFTENPAYTKASSVFKNVVIPIAYGCNAVSYEFGEVIRPHMSSVGFCSYPTEALNYLATLDLQFLLGKMRWMVSPFYSASAESSDLPSIMCDYEYLTKNNNAPLRSLTQSRIIFKAVKKDTLNEDFKKISSLGLYPITQAQGEVDVSGLSTAVKKTLEAHPRPVIPDKFGCSAAKHKDDPACSRSSSIGQSPAKLDEYESVPYLFFSGSIPLKPKTPVLDATSSTAAIFDAVTKEEGKEFATKAEAEAAARQKLRDKKSLINAVKFATKSIDTDKAGFAMKDKLNIKASNGDMLSAIQAVVDSKTDSVADANAMATQAFKAATAIVSDDKAYNSKRYTTCHSMMEKGRSFMDDLKVDVANGFSVTKTGFRNVGRFFKNVFTASARQVVATKVPRKKEYIKATCGLLTRAATKLDSWQFCNEVVTRMKQLMDYDRHTNIIRCLKQVYEGFEPNFSLIPYRESANRWMKLCDDTGVLQTTSFIGIEKSCYKSYRLLVGRSARDNIMCRTYCSYEGRGKYIGIGLGVRGGKFRFNHELCTQTCNARMLSLDSHKLNPEKGFITTKYMNSFCDWIVSYVDLHQTTPENKAEVLDVASGEKKHWKNDCQRVATTYGAAGAEGQKAFCHYMCSSETKPFGLMPETCTKRCFTLTTPPIKATAFSRISADFGKSVCVTKDVTAFPEYLKEYSSLFTNPKDRPFEYNNFKDHQAIECRSYIVNNIIHSVQNLCNHVDITQNDAVKTRCLEFMEKGNVPAMKIVDDNKVETQVPFLSYLFTTFFYGDASSYNHAYQKIGQLLQTHVCKSDCQIGDKFNVAVQKGQAKQLTPPSTPLEQEVQPMDVYTSIDNIPYLWNQDNINLMSPETLKDLLLNIMYGKLHENLVSFPYNVHVKICKDFKDVTMQKKCNDILTRLRPDGTSRSGAAEFCDELYPVSGSVLSTPVKNRYDCIHEILSSSSNALANLQDAMNKAHVIADKGVQVAGIQEANDRFHLFCSLFAPMILGVKFSGLAGVGETTGADYCKKAIEITQSKTASNKDFCYATCYSTRLRPGISLKDVQDKCMPTCEYLMTLTPSITSITTTGISPMESACDPSTPSYPDARPPVTYSLMIDSTVNQKGLWNNYCEFYFHYQTPANNLFSDMTKTCKAVIDDPALKRVTSDGIHIYDSCKTACDNVADKSNCVENCLMMMWSSFLETQYLRDPCAPMEDFRAQFLSGSRDDAERNTYTKFKKHVTAARKSLCNSYRFYYYQSSTKTYCQAIIEILRNYQFKSITGGDSYFTQASKTCDRITLADPIITNAVYGSDNGGKVTMFGLNKIQNRANQLVCRHLCTFQGDALNEKCEKECVGHIESSKDYKEKTFEAPERSKTPVKAEGAKETTLEIGLNSFGLSSWYDSRHALSAYCPDINSFNREGAKSIEAQIKSYNAAVSKSGTTTVANIGQGSGVVSSSETPLSTSSTSSPSSSSDVPATQSPLSVIDEADAIQACKATYPEQQNKCANVVKNPDGLSIGFACHNSVRKLESWYISSPRGKTVQCITNFYNRKFPTVEDGVRAPQSWSTFCETVETIKSWKVVKGYTADKCKEEVVAFLAPRTSVKEDFCYLFCNKLSEAEDKCMNACRI